MRKNHWAMMGILALSAAFATAKPVDRIVALDFGALDTISSLGDANKVVAAPIDNAPKYLANFFTGQTVENAGGLKMPQIEAIKKTNPDLIIISGRANQFYDELSTIAPTIKYAAQSDDYMDSVRQNIMEVAQKLEKTELANQKIDELHQKIADLKNISARNASKAIILLHNDGKLILSEKSNYANIIFGLAGLGNAAESGGSERVIVDNQFLSKVNPDIIYIVDRSAAIGKTPLNVAAYFQDKNLKKLTAVKNSKVVYLEPTLWYLSGGGLQSLGLQLDEIKSSLK